MEMGTFAKTFSEVADTDTTQETTLLSCQGGLPLRRKGNEINYLLVCLKPKQFQVGF